MWRRQRPLTGLLSTVWSCWGERLSQQDCVPTFPSLFLTELEGCVLAKAGKVWARLFHPLPLICPPNVHAQGDLGSCMLNVAEKGSAWPVNDGREHGELSPLHIPASAFL